jgi:SAM-dependent methyltransferase
MDRSDRIERSGEYDHRGDYHLKLDPNWFYLPVYLEKMKRVRAFIERLDPGVRILDAGCGEGVLVEEYHARGFDILGVDIHYQSSNVLRGSVLSLQFEDHSFDVVLLLDVIEHLTYPEQERALAELSRVLRPGGSLYLSIPNLAHLASRIRFIFTGKFIRTSSPDRHVGDRPIHEYLNLLKTWYTIESRVGLFPTTPLLALLTYRSPSRAVPFHRLYNRLFAYPNWCFLNLVHCRKQPRRAQRS